MEHRLDTTPRKVGNDLIGAAGVHFVCMEFSLRGLIALPTIRNTAGIDVLVSDPTTGEHAAIQVKTSMQRVSFWPTSRSKNVGGSLRTWYVFVRRGPTKEIILEAFLVAAHDVHAQVEANIKRDAELGNKEFAYWALPKDQVKVEVLRQAWKNWPP